MLALTVSPQQILVTLMGLHGWTELTSVGLLGQILVSLMGLIGQIWPSIMGLRGQATGANSFKNRFKNKIHNGFIRITKRITDT